MYRPKVEDITIRTTLRSGDLGTIIRMHGEIYAAEHHYGVEFESYVAAGLHEFYSGYDPALDRIWMCEHLEEMVGSILLMHRPNNAAQLRYFLLLPEYRGIGLGRKLMDLFIEFFREKGYASAYLWTEADLAVAAELYGRYGFVLTEEKASTAFGRPVVEQRYDLSPLTIRP